MFDVIVPSVVWTASAYALRRAAGGSGYGERRIVIRNVALRLEVHVHVNVAQAV